MAKEQNGSLINEESQGFLEDVRKGKPRRFAMICKGASVVSLVLYKKGSLEKFKKEAKEGGKGQFYHGVAEGKGRDIAFKLARADGFDSAPVKNSVLKDFLAENSDGTFKPTFEIVDLLGPVLDEDDPLVARFLKLQEAALTACDRFPERAGEINQRCLSIGGLLEKDERTTAESQIVELEQLLGGLTAQAPVAPPTPPSDDPQMAKLTEALKKLRPLVEQAIQADPTRKPGLLAAIGKAAGEIKEKQFNQANAS